MWLRSQNYETVAPARLGFMFSLSKKRLSDRTWYSRELSQRGEDGIN